MSIKVSFSFDTASEAAEFLIYVQDRVQVPEPRPFAHTAERVQDAPAAPEPTAAEPAPKKGRKPRSARVEPKVEPKVEPADPAATPPAAPTTDDLRAALKAVLARCGANRCNELLAEYGVNRVGSLAPGIYAAFLADCEAAK